MFSQAISLEHILSIWWSMTWRMVLVSFLVGLVLGAFGGLLAFAAGVPELSSFAGGLLGWLGAVPVSVWALKSALSKEHGGYRVVLIKSNPNV